MNEGKKGKERKKDWGKKHKEMRGETERRGKRNALAHTHPHTRARAHTHTRARARAHTQTHTQTEECRTDFVIGMEKAGA